MIKDNKFYIHNIKDVVFLGFTDKFEELIKINQDGFTDEKVKQENSERMDKIIDALSVISGALTTVLMVQTIRSN